MVIEEMLAELGCDTIIHASSVGEALAAIALSKPDAAVLDVNLRGELAIPVADRLTKMGVPFLFATGYGRSEMLNKWHKRQIVQKPYTVKRLATALQAALQKPH
jgi:CheY-like chemotaxis protein